MDYIIRWQTATTCQRQPRFDLRDWIPTNLDVLGPGQGVLVHPVIGPTLLAALDGSFLLIRSVSIVSERPSRMRDVSLHMIVLMSQRCYHPDSRYAACRDTIADVGGSCELLGVSRNSGLFNGLVSEYGSSPPNRAKENFMVLMNWEGISFFAMPIWMMGYF